MSEPADEWNESGKGKAWENGAPMPLRCPLRGMYTGDMAMGLEGVVGEAALGQQSDKSERFGHRSPHGTTTHNRKGHKKKTPLETGVSACKRIGDMNRTNSPDPCLIMC